MIDSKSDDSLSLDDDWPSMDDHHQPYQHLDCSLLQRPVAAADAWHLDAEESTPMLQAQGSPAFMQAIPSPLSEHLLKDLSHPSSMAHMSSPISPSSAWPIDTLHIPGRFSDRDCQDCDYMLQDDHPGKCTPFAAKSLLDAKAQMTINVPAFMHDVSLTRWKPSLVTGMSTVSTSPEYSSSIGSPLLTQKLGLHHSGDSPEMQHISGGNLAELNHQGLHAELGMIDDGPSINHDDTWATDALLDQHMPVHAPMGVGLGRLSCRRKLDIDDWPGNASRGVQFDVSLDHAANICRTQMHNPYRQALQHSGPTSSCLLDDLQTLS